LRLRTTQPAGYRIPSPADDVVGGVRHEHLALAEQFDVEALRYCTFCPEVSTSHPSYLNCAALFRPAPSLLGRELGGLDEHGATAILAEAQPLELHCVPLVPAGTTGAIQHLHLSRDNLALAYVDALRDGATCRFRHPGPIGPLRLRRNLGGVHIDLLGRLFAAYVAYPVFDLHSLPMDLPVVIDPRAVAGPPVPVPAPASGAVLGAWSW